MSRQPPTPPRSGILVVDKPSGMTSFDVIRSLRRCVGRYKYGHAGTLDPMATGVLPVMIGDATRLAELLMGTTKRYAAEVLLGVGTDSHDLDGRVVAEAPVDGLQPEAVSAALTRFLGSIEQVPPAFSALRVDGQRAYAQARRGEVVALAARTVRVFEIAGVEVAIPRVRFEVECSKGTYIRSMARDLGDLLGVPATLSSLRRLRVGRFGIAQAVTIAALETHPPEWVWSLLVDPFEALDELPTLEVSADDARALAQGQTQRLAPAAPGTYRVTRVGERTLLALLTRSEDGRVSARVFRGETADRSALGSAVNGSP